MTRGLRIAAWVVAGVAVGVVTISALWTLRTADRHAPATGKHFLVVRPITWDDLRAIKPMTPSVELAVPYVRSNQTLSSEDHNWNTGVIGTTPEYFDLLRLRLAAGTRFEATAKKDVVLGATVAAQLNSKVGDTIRIRNIPFEVVGVLEHQDLDDAAFVAMEVFTLRISPTIRFEGSVLISPASAEGDVRSLLRERHSLAPGDGDDFTIRANP